MIFISISYIALSVLISISYIALSVLVLFLWIANKYMRCLDGNNWYAGYALVIIQGVGIGLAIADSSVGASVGYWI